MRFLTRGLWLLAAAVACAAVSNALSGPERRLLWFQPADERARSVAVAAPGASAAEKSAVASTSAKAAQDKSAKAEFPPHPDKPWGEISGDDVAALHARGDVPFLDARRSSVFREGHIAGARAFAVWEADVDEKVKGFYGEGHDPSTPIVVYCGGGDCEDSHMLGQKLFFAGFNNVLVYKDGFPDWVQRGLAVTKGEKP
ncbi:MAG: rhodanese-like domain-containing protein [Thermoanaerobaculia bacterium]